ncbi:zinc dependent phospholipase C family protein [uncultured Roseobacter sp.]|uniref:zinc dependent phospholipase C family protein n=1 Tax=uncultured Roseobacter sp. TaxID=114847 RepID=UPI0026134785|nr:zinc dependent phospholipase C family protein [uncultured Roseobacter sp.]
MASISGLTRSALQSRLLPRLISLIVAVAIATPAVAWKPTTHVFIAELAARDALDDGHVEIADLETGEVRKYPVSAQTLEALDKGRAYYRAGVLGPDAYPDMATGQQYIHPEQRLSLVRDGSSRWISYIWDQFSKNTNERAFRLGFITHVAGDVYGHSFVNHFSGAPFTFDPADNAIRHVVLEGYIDKRFPSDQFDTSVFRTSIRGLEGKIYKTMVDARPGTRLDKELLPASSPAARLSVPRIFSTMRRQLDKDIKAYYSKKKRIEKAIKDCDWLDFSCSKTFLAGQLTAHVTANALQTTYKEYWVRDIDSGLKAWPGVSHQVALALFFNPERKADTDKADEILTEYVELHLLSMAGAPDFIGLSARAIGRIIDAITPEFLLAPIRKLKENLLDTILVSATGMTKNELKGYLTQPDRYFDTAMQSGKTGEKVTLARFNREYLKIQDTGYNDPAERFAVDEVPAIYNTLVLNKLLLLEPGVVNQVIADLGGSGRVRNENIMLGWVGTLDGSRQWRKGMVAGDDCDTYKRLFYLLPRDSCAR